MHATKPELSYDLWSISWLPVISVARKRDPFFQQAVMCYVLCLMFIIMLFLPFSVAFYTEIKGQIPWHASLSLTCMQQYPFRHSLCVQIKISVRRVCDLFHDTRRVCWNRFMTDLWHGLWSETDQGRSEMDQTGVGQIKNRSRSLFNSWIGFRSLSGRRPCHKTWAVLWFMIYRLTTGNFGGSKERSFLSTSCYNSYVLCFMFNVISAIFRGLLHRNQEG